MAEASCLAGVDLALEFLLEEGMNALTLLNQSDISDLVEKSLSSSC